MTSKKFEYGYSNNLTINKHGDNRKKRSKFTKSKCQKKLSIYFKLDQIDKKVVNSLLSQSINQKSINLKNKTNSQDKKVYLIQLKVMLILIIFLVCSLVSGLYSFNSDNFNRLDNVNNNSFNSSIQKNDDSIAERLSLNKNSNLFYDLTLTNEFGQSERVKKPIYFQFLSNKVGQSTRSSSNKNQFKHLHQQLNRQNSKISINHLANNHINHQISHHQNYLQRFMLNNNTVKCNDGTNPGYYFRRGRTSKWIIFLEGGWFCYSKLSCHQRWIQMRNFMTSAHWPEKKLVNGILSNKKDENSFYYNANHVFIPYCSSDSWSGNRPAKSSRDLHFSGSKIIENVIKELVLKGLYDANLVYLAGSSAGGTGVLVNLDKISNQISSINSKITVRGLIDSAWFLDNVPFKSNQNNFLANQMNDFCLNGQLCSPIDSIKAGFKHWNSQVPDSCRNEYLNEPWKCFFGHRLLPSLRTPIFVIQYLFDEAQLMADNVPIPTSKVQWSYVYKMGNYQMRSSLKNVSGLFAPSCISHTILIKKNWNQMKINGISVAEAIKCWETKQNKKSSYQSDFHSNALKNEVDMISPLHSNNYYYSNTYPNMFNLRETNSIFNRLINKRKTKNRNQIRSRNDEFNLETCSMRLVDECKFPQCNQNCPKITNIFTGKEINFFDLLKAFGLKMP